MKYLQILLFTFLTGTAYGQTHYIADATTKTPVSFATISFGDGRGTFAGAEGEFNFPKEKYADIDSIFISSIGYKELGISTSAIPKQVLLTPETNQLSEVIVTATKRGKFKKRTLKPTTHTDYFSCWLPTVESEVAVLFNRYEGKSSKIAKLLLPINVEKKYRKKNNTKFSTLFRIQFYANDNGSPGLPIKYEDIVFNVNQEDDEIYELDLTRFNVFIPKTGIFASLQVLGYADPEGKLLQNKKYNEVKTRRGIEKISTTFRPLLPFTAALPSQQTFVRRVFFNNKKWQVFDKSYNENSKLIQTGQNNYGMGSLLHVYQD
jgi:hypothetical protein